MPRAYPAILRYFQMAADNPSYFEFPQMVVPEASEVSEDVDSESTQA